MQHFPLKKLHLLSERAVLIKPEVYFKWNMLSMDCAENLNAVLPMGSEEVQSHLEFFIDLVYQ